MARLLLLLLTVWVGAACSGPGGGGTGGGAGLDPPRVFLIAPDSNPIGVSLKIQANVTGCAKIRQIQILNDKQFLVAVDEPPKVPVDIDLPRGTFDKLYNSLGIAVKLTLVAKGVCDDGRTNVSTPIGVNFFPVLSVTEPAMGNATALPDVFVAEGGAGSTPTTFVGCVGTESGTGMARFDTGGAVISANTTLPFPCSYNSVISEKNKASGYRWLLEPGIGVFSFDSSTGAALNIKAFKKNNFTQLGVGPDGDAIVWDSRVTLGLSMARLSKSGGADENPVWSAGPTGIMASTPVVSQGEVYVVMWKGSLGVFSGTMSLQKFSYADGSFIAEHELAVIEYGEFNVPVIPAATLSADGQLTFFAFQNNGGTRQSSGVVACASNSSSGCSAGSGAKWVSPMLDAVVVAAVPFSNGNLIAAIAGKKTFFLSAADGHVVNVFNAPITPDGSLVTLSAQPGNGTDFYLMNGASTGYPTEIIAVDNPLSGELWRVQIEGGGSPLSAMNLAIDEANNAWLRVGPNMVRPLTLGDYRKVKGANPPP
jgi:hypothetical protein